MLERLVLCLLPHCAAIFVLSALLTVPAAASEYTFITLAGLAGSEGSVDCTGSAARFSFPNGVVVDSAGNTRGTLDGQPAYGDVDAFLTKFTPDGTRLWSRIWGGSQHDYPMGLALDSSNQVYVAGYTWGAFDGQSMAGPGTDDSFLTKFSEDGTRLWSRIWGSSADDLAEWVILDSAGNIYVCGYDAFLTRWVPSSVAITASLMLTNVQPANAGNYDVVVVSNGVGSVTSAVATLTVQVPPVITVPPEDATADEGGSATFGVKANGTEPLRFQWSFGGSSLAGQTNYYLILTNVQHSQAGEYTVTVSNAFGTAAARARLTVTGGDPPVITVPPEDVTADVGGSATFGVKANGTEPLRFQWSFGGSSLAGQTNYYLILTNVQRSQAGDYMVTVSNAFGTATARARLTVTGGEPPVITVPPEDVTVDVGGSATFGVKANGTEPLRFQWSFSGSSLAGQANYFLILTNVQHSQAGDYTVTVSNAFGTATARARLTVNGNRPPTLDSIPDLRIPEDAPEQTVSLSGISAGPPNELQTLTVTAVSDNPALIPNPTVVYTSPQTSGVLRFRPLPNASGIATITVTVKDDGGTANGGVDTLSRTFVVTVQPINDWSTISDLPDVTINEDTTAGPLAFVITDVETLPAALKLAVSSSNPTLVPANNLVLAGTGTNRTLTATPARDQFGTSLITATVTDADGASASDSFLLTVRPVNDPPTLALLSDLTVPEGAPEQTVSLRGISAGPPNELQTLTVTAVSDNPALIPNPTVVYTSPQTSGVLRFRLLPNASGIATITVTVKDDGGTANGGVDISAPQNFVITINPRRNQPPVLAPISDQTVKVGDTVKIQAMATDPDIPANQLTYSLDTGAPAGASIDANTGVFLWTPTAVQVASTNRLMIRVIDNGAPPLSDSKTFTVVVQQEPSPINTPPVVAISTPPNRAIFTPDSDIVISATASDPDGSVSQVVFYVGTAPLSVIAASPYTVTWRSVPVGDYVLTAKATDDQGLSTASTPVTIVVSRLSGDVAIVRSSDDPGIGVMQDYLLQMGLSSVVFDQESIRFDLLQPFQAVIWDSLGGTNSKLAANTVDVFQELFDADKPLYFMGDNLASAATGLSEPQRLQWSELIHLKLATDRGAAGTVTINELEDRKHPILKGGFGNVESFGYDSGLELAAVTGPEAGVLGQSGQAAVLVSFPADVYADGERALTQNFRVTGAGGEASAEARKALFQNVICWLLRCRTCIAFHLNFEMQGPEQRVQVGGSVTYTNVIQHTGECELSGVVVTNVLAAGMRFVGADAVQGTWHYEPNLNTVVFEVGRMTSALRLETSFTVVPQIGGTLTNIGMVQASGGRGATSAQVTTIVEGSSRPILSVVRPSNGDYELRLVGRSDVDYGIQVSTNLLDWRHLTNANGSMGSMPLDEVLRGQYPRRFFRAQTP